MSQSYRPETLAIHAGRIGDPVHGSLSTPIHQTSTFVFGSAEQGAARFAGEDAGYVYSRLGNPTVRELEQRVATLEDAQDAVAFASGMAAVSAVLFGLLQPGDHIISSQALYGCTFALLDQELRRFGIEVTLLREVTPQTLSAALQDNTRLLYLETPINPTMDVIAIEPLTRLARAHGVLTAVDNTFMTPLLQQPLHHGADIVVHSATKFLNGHGDVIAGLVCCSSELAHTLRHGPLKLLGAAMAPMTAWLITRGLKTLALRMQRHQANATAVAEWLQHHPAVAAVYWPGCSDHPAQSLMGSQMHGPGGLISFELHGGYGAAVSFLNALHLCRLAVSLGDAETLIQHPASMTHATYNEEALAAAGIRPGLVRLSVGLEHVDDIISDLAHALQLIHQPNGLSHAAA